MSVNKQTILFVSLWALMGLSMYAGLRRELLVNRNTTQLNREYVERIESAVQRIEKANEVKP